MQQNQEEQDVPVGLPHGPPNEQGGAGAPLERAGAGAPNAAEAPREGAGDGPPTPTEVPREDEERASSVLVRRSLVRRRQRLGEQRPHRLTPRFSDEELEDVRVAAVVAGLTPTGYVAKAAVDLAAARLRPAPPALLDALQELLVARRQVHRFSVLVNQAVAKWHATGGAPGQVPAELLGAVGLVGRVLPRLEDAAASVRRAQDRAPQRPTVAERVAAMQKEQRDDEPAPSGGL